MLFIIITIAVVIIIWLVTWFKPTHSWLQQCAPSNYATANYYFVYCIIGLTTDFSQRNKPRRLRCHVNCAWPMVESPANCCLGLQFAPQNKYWPMVVTNEWASTIKTIIQALSSLQLWSGTRTTISCIDQVIQIHTWTYKTQGSWLQIDQIKLWCWWYGRRGRRGGGSGTPKETMCIASLGYKKKTTWLVMQPNFHRLACLHAPLPKNK